MNNTLSQLETLVDSFGLSTILDYLTNICHEKATHIRENWQDEQLAKTWEKDGKIIDNAASKLTN